MAIQLVVKHPFANFAIGAHITDPVLVAKYGASHPQFVTRKPIRENAASQQPSTPAPAAIHVTAAPAPVATTLAPVAPAAPATASTPASSPASPTVPILQPIA